MKMFIDTANVDQIREANDLGVICGVTTNPSPVSYTHLMGGSRPKTETGKGAAERADSCGETLCRCGKSRVSPKDINRSRFSFSEEKRLLLFEKKLWYHKAKGGMDMELETKRLRLRPLRCV